jgi:hypothetical protein
MRYDLFEFNGSMTRVQILWRVVVVVLLLTVLAYDLLIGRPG